MNELWRDPSTNQCYLIPEETELEEGQLELVSSTQERIRVIPEVVAVYACSSSEANQHIQERVTQMLELAGQEVGQFVQFFAKDLGTQLAQGGRPSLCRDRAEQAWWFDFRGLRAVHLFVLGRPQLDLLSAGGVPDCRLRCLDTFTIDSYHGQDFIPCRVLC